MNVQTPKVMIGIKATDVFQSGEQLLKTGIGDQYLFRNAVLAKVHPFMKHCMRRV